MTESIHDDMIHQFRNRFKIHKQTRKMA